MNMVEVAPTALERRKRRWIGVGAVALTAIAVLAIIRWTPTIDNWISGGFHPMRTIALKVGEANASAMEPQIPVAVFACDQCASQDLVPAKFVPPTRFIAVTYQEQTRAVNVMLMAGVTPGRKLAGAGTVLHIDPRHCDAIFGPPLKQPIDGMLLAYKLTFFTPYVTNAMNWRVPINKIPTPTDQDLHLTANLVRPELFPVSPAVDLDVRADRVAVARRHDATNTLLLAIIIACVAACLLAMRGLWGGYTQARRMFALWGAALNVPAFIGGDFLQRCADAERSYHQAQEREAAQARAETIARRNRMAARHKAEALLRLHLPEELRLRLHRALERDDVQAMSSAAREAEAAIAERPAEQRLEALLEPLRDLCSAGQWEEYRVRATAMLQSSGFRQARDFVVNAHARLRAEADAAEDKSEAAAS